MQQLPEEKAAGKNPVQSAQRIFGILELLAAQGKLPLHEIAQRLSLHKSTAHRLLCSLIAMGYVRKEERTGCYRLTFKLLELSGMLLEGLDIVGLARPFLERLGQQAHEAVHLVQRDGAEIVYIDKVEMREGSIRMVSRIGLRRPIYCTAVGKAMLAEMPEGKVAQLWERSRIERLTERTIISLDALFRELEEVRARGYALDNEENEIGVRCIGACILDYQGRANNALSVSAPLSRMSDRRIQELAPFILEARRKISRELGYQGAQ
ncbi:MAG: IclR family transcriptional regulator [Provencibacterium sp.]|jgi:DNA-binding IclR family transcriptional regulator|nr:IclR family transcriptional regulator [Provencibacterium sp.]